MNYLKFFVLFIIKLVIYIEAQSKLKDRSQLNEKDFVFDLQNSKPATKGLGGVAHSSNVDTFPALKGEGIANTLFSLNPCAINTPHVHPRATELFFVLSGKFKTFFTEENGGRTIVNEVSTGQVTFFPQGLIHGEQNIGCETAQFLAAFGNEDPGVEQIANRLFTLPDEALTSTFNLPKEKINEIRAGIMENPVSGFDTECLARCGLTKSSY